MKIEWDESVRPPPGESLWARVKNSLSVIRPQHDGLKPRVAGPRSRRNSHAPTPTSRGNSSSGHTRSSSHGRSYSYDRRSPPPTRPQTSQGYRSPTSGSGGRPLVTVSTNNGPAVPVYGASRQRPGTAVRSSTTPLRSPPARASPRQTPHASGGTTPAARPRPPAPQRSATSPATATPGGGKMYRGKMIVGDPQEVDRYIKSQQGVEKWLAGNK